MSTRASIGSHPIHSMMIGLPVGLFVFSFFSDLVWLYTRSAQWETVAFYTLAGAIVTALLSAIPGFIDYGGLRHERSRSVARWHMVLNLIAVALGVVSLWMRWGIGEDRSMVPIALAAATVAVLGVSGWLGATLVHVHGVSQPDAPNEQKVQTIDARADTAPMAAASIGATQGQRTTRATPGAPLGGLHPAVQSGRDDAPTRAAGSAGTAGADRPSSR